jgi:SagB-type dehydrogenase family enzyme
MARGPVPVILLGPALAWMLSGCGAPTASDGPGFQDGAADATNGPSIKLGEVRPLPSPERRGGMALTESLDRRRSVRSFAVTPLTDAELGQLLWAAQGLTGAAGGRTSPSAGATYPLELVVATADGLFRYLVADHALRLVAPGDVRPAIGGAAVGQEWIADAPVVVVIAAVPDRTAARYGARATRYVALEAGHAAQSLLLQATALGLGAVPVGAFDDDRLGAIVGLDHDEEPLYVVPIGHPAG